MNKKILGMAIAGLVLSTGAQASFVLDDFTEQTTGNTNNSPANPTVEANSGIDVSTMTTSDFTNTRNLDIQMNPASFGGAGALVFAGDLSISTGTGTGSDTTLAYNNASGFDFTVMEASGAAYTDAFVLAVASIDQGGVNITMTIDGVSVAQNNITTIQDVVFNQSSFAGVDFATVNDIEILIHNNVAVDATFVSLETYGQEFVRPPEPTPEPATFALMGLGLAGLGFRRKAKKA